MQEAVMRIFMIEYGAVAWIPEGIPAEENPVKYRKVRSVQWNV